MESLIDAALPVARRAAAAATAVHRKWAARRCGLEVREKGRSDYVSGVDHEAEEAALAVIRGAFPDHGIMAEESSDPSAFEASALEGPVWVVDPLDGTANYLHGHPAHAASVALAIDGSPVVGVVEAGRTAELWSAARGRGCFKNGRGIRVSPRRGLEHALVGTGFPFKRESLLDEYAGQLTEVLVNTAGVRRAGSAALDLAYVADGTFECFWELHLNPWDFAAGWLLVQEAGGVVGRVEEAPLGLVPGTVAAANSPETLAELRNLLFRKSR